LGNGKTTVQGLIVSIGNDHVELSRVTTGSGPSDRVASVRNPGPYCEQQEGIAQTIAYQKEESDGPVMVNADRHVNKKHARGSERNHREWRRGGERGRQKRHASWLQGGVRRKKETKPELCWLQSFTLSLYIDHVVSHHRKLPTRSPGSVPGAYCSEMRDSPATPTKFRF
jgi:hypothetical protein